MSFGTLIKGLWCALWLRKNYDDYKKKHQTCVIEDDKLVSVKRAIIQHNLLFTHYRSRKNYNNNVIKVLYVTQCHIMYYPSLFSVCMYASVEAVMKGLCRWWNKEITLLNKNLRFALTFIFGIDWLSNASLISCWKNSLIVLNRRSDRMFEVA